MCIMYLYLRTGHAPFPPHAPLPPQHLLCSYKRVKIPFIISSTIGHGSGGSSNFLNGNSAGGC